MTDDEKAIRAVIAQWMADSKSGNVDAVLALMTDDVMFLTAQAAPFGKAEFAQNMSTTKGMTFDGRSEVKEVEIRDDLAFVRAELTIDITLPDGKTMRRAGPSLSIFRKGPDGHWRISRDANLVR